ncbi:esterase-like activity of phytase family protein [Amycolatopsis aidingensis]|uniref:esterase-like activity of phytase family protein n=1 Tax=Amycolatopsis aidingensis TaxID=2842453 RepID=UPI001E447BF8|nr:esterase-like activity of phytase family protein [Amycolatopsis aidingensis]
MRTRRLRMLAAGMIGTLTLGLLAAPPAAGHSPSVRLLGERVLPHGLEFRGTTVGGLSGIDRDPRTGEYVLISDDRGAARYYTARIPLGPRGLGEVRLTGVHVLRRPDGAAYPSGSVDPEELRVDPWRGRYYWSEEGDRIEGRLRGPSIRVAEPGGAQVRRLRVPDNWRMTEDTGPRRNLGPEGFTFAGCGALVMSALEAPLLQDGPVPTPAHGALTRITLQPRYGPAFAQYAYPVEPVFTQPDPPDGYSDNGVTSILAAGPADPTRYLVLERGYVAGVGNKVRIFRIDTSGASNVLHRSALAGARLRPVRKKLLADLSDLPLSRVDNIEGMAWGPRLPTGERTLLLVSDDNFAAGQVTQVVALALRGQHL